MWACGWHRARQAAAALSAGPTVLSTPHVPLVGQSQHIPVLPMHLPVPADSSPHSWVLWAESPGASAQQSPTWYAGGWGDWDCPKGVWLMQCSLAWLRGTTRQRSGEDTTWEYGETVGIPTVAAGGHHGVLGPLDSSSPCGSALPRVHPCPLSPPAPAAHRVSPAMSPWD